ncbi:Uncharacterised protein [Staphylococcus petrasii]|uniref:Uncharacterized protein n=1 Tax=Staphylococcus petrasii TaxID=1276936 RepID=A0A380FXK4_9STAP|nr:hypothetical protein [Staphylococcus petrasii]MCI2774372.1 hypothetical protein [Staphylococcus petrasii]PNZ25210.1 hypothetical protein CD137_11225 [Staphylococcus petrasii]PNZ81533.1 hypothetical protein CD127_07560 [Staphylococcus petrasii]TGA81650.1 hypothetical protein E2554_09070 [Staphylococcus petrasii]TGE13609.1 hypothetical protein E2557_00525 [Staphylococcus petrasii]
MLRLSIIFLVFVINTTITHYFTVKGTWENLLFESMSLSMILVFLFYYVSFVIEEKKRKKIEELKERFYTFQEQQVDE